MVNRYDIVRYESKPLLIMVSQDSMQAISPKNNLMDNLIEDLGRSYKNLASCGYSEV
jgi:hypothetical protein